MSTPSFETRIGDAQRSEGKEGMKFPLAFRFLVSGVNLVLNQIRRGRRQPAQKRGRRPLPGEIKKFYFIYFLHTASCRRHCLRWGRGDTSEGEGEVEGIQDAAKRGNRRRWTGVRRTATNDADRGGQGQRGSADHVGARRKYGRDKAERQAAVQPHTGPRGSAARDDFTMTAFLGHQRRRNRPQHDGR